MIIASQNVLKYFTSLESGTNACLEVAMKAREKGFDPSAEVEIAPASDVAARVEGLVGPKAVAERIRILTKNMSREQVCFEIANEIMGKKFFEGTTEKLIDQAVRTSLALYTEGVVSAPIEGVSRFKIRQNADGSSYLAIFFAGPIRGAGGTGQAFAVILADYCRRFFGLAEYRPTDDEVGRFVEEINLYGIKTRAGQYVPTAEEVTHVVKSCGVCIDGEPTEDYEVNVHKGLFETPRVRSGICLVISEGLCLKAAKVLKITKAIGLEWSWIEKLVKVSKKSTEQVEIKKNEKYMDEIVGGRPIFSYPLTPGGFRLRYGRTRFTGIQSKAIHPAAMVLLDEFPVFGTQMKTERPGKGCVVTPCENIEGPIVLMNDGSVKRITTLEEAFAVRVSVKEILFLGDLLVNYGDFLKSNHVLLPPGYNEEWHILLLKEKGIIHSAGELREQSFTAALDESKQHALALSPVHTLPWKDLELNQLSELVTYLAEDGRLELEWFDLQRLFLKTQKQKRLLELLGVEHSVSGDGIVIEKNPAQSLLVPLGLLEGKSLSKKKFSLINQESKSVLEIINELSPVKVMDKAGFYVGTSMGRPEKSRERKMQPPVHSLFPLSYSGGKMRDIMKAFETLRASQSKTIEVELENRFCPNCQTKIWQRHCPACNSPTSPVRQCVKCGKLQAKEQCTCGGMTSAYDKKVLPFGQIIDAAIKKIQFHPVSAKGVIGLISAAKTPELLEKGLLRSKHNVYVFRDGTCRYDATEVPITHFVPSEIGLSLEKTRELGYVADFEKKEITDLNQVIELLPQDVVISRQGAEYFLRLTKFVDDLLVYLYNLPPFYNCKKPEDLVGHLLIAIAPHTSAGIVTRIIGFSEVQALLAHPYLHCACRRNTDGDELGVMLVLDGFLNFSKQFLPETRGAKMDAPLVLTTVLDPREVDDEVHSMDSAFVYPLEFYDACAKYASPNEVKMDVLGKRLGQNSQYEGIGFTHHASINCPTQTRYVQMKDMQQKVEMELELMSKIRAVDASNAAERIINSHFFPDLYGNLHSFSKQSFRCVDCTVKYRRVPLSGKCNKCGGKLLLTISKGGIEKYLEISQNMANKYHLPEYLKQRLMLIRKEIESTFTDDRSKQFSLQTYL